MAGNALVDYATEHLQYFHMMGHAPNACMILPFGSLKDPSHLFPAQEFKDLELQLTGESGAGAIRVVTQQLRT